MDGGCVCARSVNASKAVVTALICCGVNLNCGVLNAFNKNQLVERLAADTAEFGCEVLGLLDTVDFMATCASVLDHKTFAVLDLLRSRGIKMHVGEEVWLGLGLQESGQN